MMTRTRVLFAGALLLALSGAAWAKDGAGNAAESGGEAGYIAENRVAMARMMKNMDVGPTGDVDQDFTAMMIPHHQGAIDMARAELRYGHNKQLRRIAREIVANQQGEIVAMRRALDRPLPAASARAPAGTGMDMPKP